MKEFAQGVVIGLLIVIALLTAMRFELEDDRQAEREYCEMRALYEATNGEYGWPEYKDSVQCGGAKDN